MNGVVKCGSDYPRIVLNESFWSTLVCSQTKNHNKCDYLRIVFVAILCNTFASRVVLFIDQGPNKYLAKVETIKTEGKMVRTKQHNQLLIHAVFHAAQITNERGTNHWRT